MMTMNELMTMTSMKYLSLHWMYQGLELWMPSIFPTFEGLSSGCEEDIGCDNYTQCLNARSEAGTKLWNQ